MRRFPICLGRRPGIRAQEMFEIGRPDLDGVRLGRNGRKVLKGRAQDLIEGRGASEA